MSTLADLDEFIAMGIEAEKLTGKKVLPMSPDEIKSKVAAMRSAIPGWIWDAVKELEDAIRSDPMLVPFVMSQADVDRWRAILGWWPSSVLSPVSSCEWQDFSVFSCVCKIFFACVCAHHETHTHTQKITERRRTTRASVTNRRRAPSYPHTFDSRGRFLLP